MAVVDSSALIHLCRVGKLRLLNQFFDKIKITPDIHNEVKEGVGAAEIEKGCKTWILIREPKTDEAENISKSEGIEKADASIILLAKEGKDILISNDYALIAVAKSRGIECWWLTTFLLRCLRKKLVTREEAKQTLFELVESGMRLDNAVYAAILKEIDDHVTKSG